MNQEAPVKPLRPPRVRRALLATRGVRRVPHVVLASSFDAAGNRASLAATIGGTKDFVNTYEYDALSRVTEIEQTGVTNGNTVAYKELDYTFDPLGDVTSRAAYSTSNTPRSDAATGQYGYNSLGQLTSLNYTSNAGATAIDDLGWSFDSLGRVSTFSSIDGTATYGYDSVNEVTSASYSTNSGGHQPTNETYSFDANGNRSEVDSKPTTMGVNNEVTNDGTYAYTFDAEGNRTMETPDTGAPSSDHPASFTYDYRNRLVEVQEFNNATPPTLTEQINYTYDVNDDLIERVDDLIGSSTTTTHYVWDNFSPLPSGEGQGGGGIVLAFNGTGQLTTRYLNGPNTSAYDQYFTTLAGEDVADGKVTFDLRDELGTVRDVVDATGQPVDHLNYNAYGVQVYASAPSITPLGGFAGGLYDPSTNLLNYIHRWYDPTATVWIQADPTGFAAGDTNLTRYVYNGPTNLDDPAGLAPPPLGPVSGYFEQVANNNKNNFFIHAPAGMLCGIATLFDTVYPRAVPQAAVDAYKSADRVARTSNDPVQREMATIAKGLIVHGGASTLPPTPRPAMRPLARVGGLAYDLTQINKHLPKTAQSARLIAREGAAHVFND